jgi:hypothetical protein
MKKSLTLLAVVAAVCGFGQSALAGFDQMENSRVYSSGHTPGAEVLLVMSGQKQPTKIKVNACGLAELPVVDNAVYYGTTEAYLSGTSISNSGDTIPIAAAPVCNSGTLATPLPPNPNGWNGEPIYKNGSRVWVKPAAGTIDVWTTKTGADITLKAKANACGIARHNLTNFLAKYGGANSNWSEDNKVMQIGATVAYIDGNVLIDDSTGNPANGSSRCVKGITYRKAPTN